MHQYVVNSRHNLHTSIFRYIDVVVSRYVTNKGLPAMNEHATTHNENVLHVSKMKPNYTSA